MNINELNNLKAQAYDLLVLQAQKQQEIQQINNSINELSQHIAKIEEQAQTEEAAQIKKEP